MKNTIKFFGVIAIVAIIGFSFIACGGDDSDDGDNNNSNNNTPDSGSTGGNGTFTITGIPAKCNGLYAVAYAWNNAGSASNADIWGFGSINTSTRNLTAVQISNGSVSIPLWKFDNGNYVRYSGNDNNYRAYILISNIQSSTVAKIPFDRTDFNLTTPSSWVGVGFPAFSFSNGNATKTWADNNDIDNGSWLNSGSTGGGATKADFYGKWQTTSGRMYDISETVIIYTYNADTFKLTNLTVTAVTNTNTDYPSGFTFSGTISESTMTTRPNGNTSSVTFLMHNNRGSIRPADGANISNDIYTKYAGEAIRQAGQP